MALRIAPLGVDNVFFRVTDLDAAIAFYEGCGLRLKFRVDAKNMALFSIGEEAPGLVLSSDQGTAAGRLWLEVADARLVAEALSFSGMTTRLFDTATGLTCEVTDPDGNVLGFADYRHRPELARGAN